VERHEKGIGDSSIAEGPMLSSLAHEDGKAEESIEGRKGRRGGSEGDAGDVEPAEGDRSKEIQSTARM